MNPTTPPGPSPARPGAHCQPMPHICGDWNNANNHCPEFCCPNCCPSDCYPPAQVITIAVSELVGMLEQVDDFLRCGNGVEHLLAAYYAARHSDPNPYYSAYNLIDAVSFAAVDLHHVNATSHGPVTDDLTEARQ